MREEPTHMDHLQKFLRKLDGKTRARLLTVIAALAQEKLQHLDVKPLKGQKGWFRCRVGNIRIVFLRTKGAKTIIYDIGFRGEIYK